MKVYNITADTPCYVVSDITAENATIKPFFTRKDLSFPNIVFDRVRARNQSGSHIFVDTAQVRNWNAKTLTKAVQLVSRHNMIIFQEQNRNNKPSLLIVNENNVEVLC